MRATALPWERIGARLWPAFCGVIIVEAIKQVYAEIRVPAKKAAFIPIPALPGLSPVREVAPGAALTVTPESAGA
jgi:hypothetical protein